MQEANNRSMVSSEKCKVPIGLCFQLYAAKSTTTDTLTWLLHHHDQLRLHQLIDNSSSQRVHLIIVIQDITAMTVVGNRGGDKGRH